MCLVLCSIPFILEYLQSNIKFDCKYLFLYYVERLAYSASMAKASTASTNPSPFISPSVYLIGLIASVESFAFVIKMI